MAVDQSTLTDREYVLVGLSESISFLRIIQRSLMQREIADEEMAVETVIEALQKVAIRAERLT